MNLKPYKKPKIVTGEEKVVFAIPVLIMASAAAIGTAVGLAKGVVDVIHVDGVRTINRKA